jgi:hypothetical protein
MEVHLDPDPLIFGPKRLNEKVAGCRSHLSRCERIYLQVSQDLAVYQRVHRVEQYQFDLEVQSLLDGDNEVRAGRNAKMQEAIATIKLRPQKESLDSLDVCIQDLVRLLAVVKAKRADLRDIQGRIRDQSKLCHEEIGLGNGWGSRPPPALIDQMTPDIDSAPLVDQEALAALTELTDDDDPEVHVSSSSLLVARVLAEVAEDEAPEVEEEEEEAEGDDMLLEEEDDEVEEEEDEVEEEEDEEESLGLLDMPIEDEEDGEDEVAAPDSEAKVGGNNLSDKSIGILGTDVVIEPEPTEEPEIEVIAGETSFDDLLGALTAGEDETPSQDDDDEVPETVEEPEPTMEQVFAGAAAQEAAVDADAAEEAAKADVTLQSAYDNGTVIDTVGDEPLNEPELDMSVEGGAILPDPEVEEAPAEAAEIEAPAEAAEVDDTPMNMDLFGDDDDEEEAPEPAKTLPSVETDEEVDHYLARLETEVPGKKRKKGAKPDDTAEMSVDDLLGMFGGGSPAP